MYRSVCVFALILVNLNHILCIHLSLQSNCMRVYWSVCECLCVYIQLGSPSPVVVVVQFFSSSPDGQFSIPSHTCVHYKYRKQNRLKIWLSWKFQIWNNLEWKQFVSQQWHEECTLKCCYFQLKVVFKKCSAKIIIQTWTTGIHFP